MANQIKIKLNNLKVHWIITPVNGSSTATFKRQTEQKIHSNNILYVCMTNLNRVDGKKLVYNLSQFKGFKVNL